MHLRLKPYIDDGLIRSQTHPTEDLIIYNYTQKCQVEGAWDEVTLMARGLILDGNDNIVARPFKKFFNLSENKTTIPTTEPLIYDKLDGSLGILYWIGDMPHIATRGSFTSEQAIKGTEMLRKWENVYNQLDKEYTYLFEIIYPSNRIVVDYKETEELVFLGAVHIETGLELPPKSFPFINNVMASALKLTQKEVENPRDNREGVVLIWPEEQVKVKVKYDEYVRLHRLVTGVNAKTIWDLLRNGDSFDDLLNHVPEEFYDWVKKTRSELQGKFDTMELVAKKVLENVQAMTRKEAAEYMQKNEQKVMGVVFSMMDGKEYASPIWKTLRPRAEKPFNQEV